MEYAPVSRRLLMSSCAWLRYQASQQFTTVRVLNQNHYEVLGVQRDCTPAEVRETFIRLSKKLHPDANPDSPECHRQFVAINEAYSVLSKPALRQAYDTQLAIRGRADMQTYGDIRTNAPRRRVIFRDESLWEHRDKSEFYKNMDQPYYGVKGVKKLPNSYIAVGAVIFLVVGAILQFYLAKISSDFTIEQLNLRDQVASQHYTKARERARMNGNTLQLALLRQKYEDVNGTKLTVKPVDERSQ